MAESAADAAIGSSVDAIVQKTEQELGISNNSPKVMVTNDKSVDKSYARNLSQKLL